jgi:hypothetical protein
MSVGRWLFDLEDRLWVWRLRDSGGTVVRESAVRFEYYLDAVADARQSGFDGLLEDTYDSDK